MIDDSVLTADGLRELLEIEGYDAHVAYDATSGLSQARLLVPDIIVCDLSMPEVSGLDFARRFRADRDAGNAILVAFSGRAEYQDVSAALSGGFDAHMTKPLLVDDLLRVLDRLAVRRRGQLG